MYNYNGQKSFQHDSIKCIYVLFQMTWHNLQNMDVEEAKLYVNNQDSIDIQK